jgi:hypothetical protein
MFNLTHIFAFLLVIISFSQKTIAKDLTQRLGVGVRHEGALAQAVVQYYPTADYTWVGGLGFDTKPQESQTHLSIALRRHIFFEQNLNYYAGGRVTFVSQEGATQTNSGFALAAISGVEFFFQGLENLGFQAEVGAELSTIGSVSRFRTVGGTLAQTGVVFYF